MISGDEPDYQAAVDAASATRAASQMTIPTYDGSGVVVHPDVVDTGVAGWNGYRYWMAFTPYPNTNDDYENPSVVASNDKETWVVPDGLTNPIVPFPGGELFNNDCDMVLVGSTMYLFYQEASNLVSDTEIYYKTSSDGITWSAATHIDVGAAFPESFKSPAFIKTNDGWEMFFANSRLYKTTAATLGGTWSAPVEVLNHIGILSHADVILSGGVYYAILMNTDYTLQFAASFNGGTVWHYRTAEIITKGSAGQWDDQGFYRATIQRTATGFDMWYTGIGSVSSWQFGYTPITYSDP